MEACGHVGEWRLKERATRQVAKEVWLCEHKKVSVWKGDILEYKKKLHKDVAKKLKDGLTTPQ